MINLGEELVENIRNHEDLDAAIKLSIKPLKPKDSEKITKKCYILDGKKIEYDPLRFIPQLLSDSFTVEDKLRIDTQSKYIWEQYDEGSDYYTVIEDKNLFKYLEVMFLRNKDLFENLNKNHDTEIENNFNKKIDFEDTYLDILIDGDNKYQLNHVTGYLNGESMLKYLRSPSEQIYFEGKYKHTLNGENKSIKIRRCHDYTLKLDEDKNKRKRNYKSDPCSNIRTEIDRKRDIEEEDINFQDVSDQVESHAYKYENNKGKCFNLYLNFPYQSICEQNHVSEFSYLHF